MLGFQNTPSSKKKSSTSKKLANSKSTTCIPNFSSSSFSVKMHSKDAGKKSPKNPQNPLEVYQKTIQETVKATNHIMNVKLPSTDCEGQEARVLLNILNKRQEKLTNSFLPAIDTLKYISEYSTGQILKTTGHCARDIGWVGFGHPPNSDTKYSMSILKLCGNGSISTENSISSDEGFNSLSSKNRDDESGKGIQQNGHKSSKSSSSRNRDLDKYRKFDKNGQPINKMLISVKSNSPNGSESGKILLEDASNYTGNWYQTTKIPRHRSSDVRASPAPSPKNMGQISPVETLNLESIGPETSLSQSLENQQEKLGQLTAQVQPINTEQDKIIDPEASNATSIRQASTIAMTYGPTPNSCHPDRVKKYICEYCGDAFFRKDEKKRHIRCKHTHEKKFTCQFCNKSFARSDHCETHKLIHLPKNERPYKCKICDKRFCRRDEMKRHFKTKHNKLYEDSSMSWQDYIEKIDIDFSEYHVADQSQNGGQNGGQNNSQNTKNATTTKTQTVTFAPSTKLPSPEPVKIKIPPSILPILPTQTSSCGHNHTNGQVCGHNHNRILSIDTSKFLAHSPPPERVPHESVKPPKRPISAQLNLNQTTNYDYYLPPTSSSSNQTSNSYHTFPTGNTGESESTSHPIDLVAAKRAKLAFERSRIIETMNKNNKQIQFTDEDLLIDVEF